MKRQIDFTGIPQSYDEEMKNDYSPTTPSMYYFDIPKVGEKLDKNGFLPVIEVADEE